MGDPHANPTFAIITRTWKAFWSAVCHPTSLLIPLFGVLLAFKSPIGVIPVDVATLASTTFTVAGTMVALILPASQLANSFVAKVEEELPKKILTAQVSANEKVRIAKELTDPLRDNLFPAWRASALVFASFVLSMLAMLAPSSSLPLGSLHFSFDSLLVALALGSLMLGSAWFLPTAHYAFSLQVLQDIKETIEQVAGHQGQAEIEAAARKSAEETKRTKQALKEETERVGAEEARRAEEEAERARAEEEARKAQEEAKRAREENARKAQDEAERAREEEARKAQEEAERAREEEARKAQEEAERAREKEARKAQDEAERARAEEIRKGS